MKIGILTYHRIVNEGSILQAYCMVRYLKSRFPNADVEIIDYRSWMVEKREYRRAYTLRPPFVRNRVELAKQKTLRKFFKENCPVSRRSIVTDKLSKASRFIEKQGYDAVVVGSDTVWEVRPNGGAPLAPNIFFLPNTKGPRKIAFAASADQTKLELLSGNERKDILACLVDDFDFIAVRDQFTEAMLLDMGIAEERIHPVPDPSVLWDFSGIVEKGEGLSPDDKPLIGVGLASRAHREEATRFFLGKGYNVVNLLGDTIPGQLHIPHHYSFQQRLGVFASLAANVTDRFHGSIMTMKLAGVPVLCVEPSSKYPNGLSKCHDLLKKLDLEEFLFRSDGEAIGDTRFELLLEHMDKYTRSEIASRFEVLLKKADGLIEELKVVLGSEAQ